jgi:hypothetical protein
MAIQRRQLFQDFCRVEESEMIDLDITMMLIILALITGYLLG